MKEGNEHFDDPALKSAVREAFGREHAPSALRGRIERALVVEAIETEPTTADLSWWARWQSPVYAGIAALVIIGAIGVLVGTWFGVFERHETFIHEPIAIEIPQDFATSLVLVHRQCSGAADHFAIARSARADLKAVGQEAKTKVAFPVLAVSPGDDWKFKGASQCSVGANMSIHLVFTRGDETLSLFSLPAQAIHCNIESAEYDGTVSGSPVACFTFHGALFCVVGHSGGSLDLPAIVKIRNQMRSAAWGGGCSMMLGGPMVASAHP